MKQDVDALWQQAQAAAQQGHVQEAKTQYQQLLDAGYERAKIHFRLGLIYYHEKNFHQAIHHYQHVIAEEKHQNSYYNLALCYLKTQQTAEGIRCLQQVLNLWPEHHAAKELLGNIFLQQHAPALALKYYLTTHPTEREYSLLYNMGNCYCMLAELPEAHRCLQQAHQLAPDDRDILYNLGVVAMKMGDWQTALQWFDACLQQAPHDLSALLNIAAILVKKEDKSAALEQYRFIHEKYPDNAIANYFLAVLTQDKQQPIPDKAPQQYVRELFTDYAQYYEKHMLGLHYQLPQQIETLLLENGFTTNSNLNVLELGCGTGLCGEILKKYARFLCGIDISLEMLKVARVKQAYDGLLQADIEEALGALQIKFDVIVAADVFLYYGDLSTVITACYRLLSPTGVLIFNVEASEHKEYQLLNTGRYAHHPQYITQLAKATHGTIKVWQRLVTRQQAQQAVLSDLYLLTR